MPNINGSYMDRKLQLCWWYLLWIVEPLRQWCLSKFSRWFWRCAALDLKCGSSVRGARGRALKILRRAMFKIQLGPVNLNLERKMLGTSKAANMHHICKGVWSTGYDWKYSWWLPRLKTMSFEHLWTCTGTHCCNCWW